MKQFNVMFKFVENIWIANCSELNVTLSEGSFDALVIRMKVAIQDIAEVELGYKDDIRLVISVQDRVEDIKKSII
jgi:hypothetical protein